MMLKLLPYSAELHLQKLSDIFLRINMIYLIIDTLLSQLTK